MKIIMKFLAVFSLVGLALPSGSVFANSYNMNYTGGVALGTNNNVVFDSGLVDGLTPLIATNNDEMGLSFSNSTKWEEGFIKTASGCRGIKYFRVSDNNQIDASDNLSFSISYRQYKADIAINNVEIDSVDSLGQNQSYTVGVSSRGFLNVGYRIYKDEKCETIADSSIIRNNYLSKIFVKMNLKLYEKASEKVFTSDKLYFGIIDIDAAQSYKILNESDKLTSGRMYARTAAGLQPTDPDITLRNIFDSNNSYIYSQYSNTEPKAFNIEDEEGVWSNSVFTKISVGTQEQGIDLVYGYVQSAGSSIGYYAKQYQVNYVSDSNGTISGIKEETILSGQSPYGTTLEANDGYLFSHWTCDKDVTLLDSAIIKAGESITPEQVKTVVVNEDLIFTAHNITDSDLIVPNTGHFTEESDNATLTFISIIGIAVVAAIIVLLPIFIHKRVSFEE